jgi:hypothetical protein
MQISYFEARCPFEIGDHVTVNNIVCEITDIVCMNFIRSGKVDFRFELDCSGEYVGLKLQDMNQSLGTETAKV